MAFDEIYREIAPKLQSYLTGNGCSYASACDIVQETFLRLWKRRDELEDDLHQISGLIFTIARNYRNDLARKAQHEVFGDGSENESDEIAEPSGDVVRPCEEAEEVAALRRRLKATLSRMPAPLLETFALSRIGEMSLKEIADGTGMSETNVKVRVHRARELFMSRFEQAGDTATTAPGSGAYASALLGAMMMLAAVDGAISKEELALYREFARNFHGADEAAYEELWVGAVRAMAYIGFLSEVVTPEELVKEFAREFHASFASLDSEKGFERGRVVETLERMARADGEYSRIERACIAAVSAKSVRD